MRAHPIGLAALVSVIWLQLQGAQVQSAEPAPETGRRWVVFVDDLHLDFRNTGRLRECLRTIVAELAVSDDRVGIVTTGPSSVALDLTLDRDALDRAIQRISGAGLRPADVRSLPRPGRRQPDEVGHRAHIALSTASDVLATLEATGIAPLALIFVSNGYDLDVVPESSDAATASGRPNFRIATDVDLLAFIERAKQAKITIHSVDTRTLPGTPPADPADAPWLERTRRSLRDIAAGTGGVAVLDATNLPDRLKEIAAISK
jgi:hypothetical protein